MSGTFYHQFENSLLKSIATLAEAAKTAAEAYAKHVETEDTPKYVVNISHDEHTRDASDVAAAVKRALRIQDR